MITYADSKWFAPTKEMIDPVDIGMFGERWEK